MDFADIHFHGLWGVDDGPKTEQEMYALLDAAYAEGTRWLCVTPHFHPGYFPENWLKVPDTFEQLQQYAAGKYPDMEIFLGNELRYDRGADSWLESSLCRTMNHTRYVLVDFRADEASKTILRAVNQLLCYGLTPILAHPERYSMLSGDLREIREMKASGVVIQLDGMSILGGFGLGTKMRSRKILKCGLADIIGSDAHNTAKRPPVMQKSFDYVSGHYGRRYARALCRDNPLAVLLDHHDGKGTN